MAVVEEASRPSEARAMADAPPGPAGAASRLAASGRGVAALLVVFALLWGGHLAWVANVAPIDNLEQLVWSRGLEWGYYKHPPLPTWLLAAATTVLGWRESTSYLLGAATTLGALAVFWWLARRLRGSVHAFVALLATLCVTFYNGRLIYYNHNVLLLLWVCASAAATWVALQRRSLPAWALLGVCLGLGGLSKYQMVLAAACVLGCWLERRAWRDPVQVAGLLLAGGLSFMMFSPHLAWFVKNGAQPMAYALESSLAKGTDVTQAPWWLVDQLLNRALPAWLLLAVAAWSTRGAPPRTEPGDAPGRRFLLIWGLLPMAIMLLMGLLGRVELQLHWSAPFLPWVVLAVMELWRPRAGWSAARAAPVWTAFVLLQALLLAHSLLTSPVGLARFRGDPPHWRHFPADALAAAVAPAASVLPGGRAHLVMGPYAEAGALALRLPGQPLVRMYVDHRYQYSPWVPYGMDARCGAVEVIRTDERLPVPPSDATPLGEAWPNVYWRVLLPAGGAPPCE